MLPMLIPAMAPPVRAPMLIPAMAPPVRAAGEAIVRNCNTTGLLI